MRIWQVAALSLTMTLTAFSPAIAEDQPQSASPQATAAAAPQSSDTAFTDALDKVLFAAPADLPDFEKTERNALAEFYHARQGAPVWIAATGLNAKGEAVAKEIDNAGDWGLEAKDFALPTLPAASDGAQSATPEIRAAAEVTLSLAVLKYARHARGGRIMDPAESLNTNLDRKPQLLEPKTVLDGIAQTDAPGDYLKSLHPKHPQFEKLRQAYLAAQTSKSLNVTAKRIRANMEQWRWMPGDMGNLHVFNNIPEFMQYVYKDGQIVRSEKIVAGRIDKQSSIFSRPLKHVVLRPMWRVPESIKVNELWPSLLRGGGLMREFGLQLETKDGKPLDYHNVDWKKNDIRNYEVTQPPGGKSVLGVVKFSFPSQHTIYMHDTPDRWMFRPAQRTLSHGCLRVKNPVELAEIILQEDKGWDKAKVAELIRSGPLNNEVAMDKKIAIHLVYFTAWVDANGKLKTFYDIYGHEKRIIQALDGQWDKINKGRDHLAPVQPNFKPSQLPVAERSHRPKEASAEETLSGAFGMGF